VSAAADRHFEQARQNRDLAQELLRDHDTSPTYVQWAVTVAFYCAVHAIQGYLVDLGRDPKTHAVRDAEIANPMSRVPMDMYREYMALKQLSEKAHYRCGIFDPAWVQRSVIDGRLKTITDFVSL
jgi:HEPN domain-containing protein